MLQKQRKYDGAADHEQRRDRGENEGNDDRPQFSPKSDAVQLRALDDLFGHAFDRARQEYDVVADTRPQTV